MSLQNLPPVDSGVTPLTVALLKRSFAAPAVDWRAFLAHAALPGLLLYLHRSRTLDIGTLELPEFFMAIPGFGTVLLEFLAFGLFLAGWYRVRNGIDPARLGPVGVLLSRKTLIFLLAFACVFLADHILKGALQYTLVDVFAEADTAPRGGILPGPLFSSLIGYGLIFIAIFAASTAIPRAAEGDSMWFSHLTETLGGRYQLVAAIALSIFVMDFFFVGFGLNAIIRIFPEPDIRYDVILSLSARFYFVAVAAAALSLLAFARFEDDEDEGGA